MCSVHAFERAPRSLAGAARYRSRPFGSAGKRNGERLHIVSDCGYPKVIDFRAPSAGRQALLSRVRFALNEALGTLLADSPSGGSRPGIRAGGSGSSALQGREDREALFEGDSAISFAVDHITGVRQRATRLEGSSFTRAYTTQSLAAKSSETGVTDEPANRAARGSLRSPSAIGAPNGGAPIPHTPGAHPTSPGQSTRRPRACRAPFVHERPSAAPGDRVARCLHLTRFLLPRAELK
jgi:hypothetical protein